jgi:hypothetical protein
MPKMDAREEIEVYVNDAGEVVLKQRDSLGNEPKAIFLHPDQVATVAQWILDAGVSAAKVRNEYVRGAEAWKPGELSEAAQACLQRAGLARAHPNEISDAGKRKLLRAANGAQVIVDEIDEALAHAANLALAD